MSDAPPIDTPFHARDLPSAAVDARLRLAREWARLEPVAAPRIAAVLTSCKAVADQLEEMHRFRADSTDLDLSGYSRAAAIWLLSGRMIGLLRAVLVQVEAGVCDEALVTGRTIYEARTVLAAFCVPNGDVLARKWLDDKGKQGYVRQKEALDAHGVWEAELREAMVAAGHAPIGDPRPGLDDLYDKMSRVAHNRRSSMLSSVSTRARRMSYGVEPSPIRRAEAAEWAAGVTTLTLTAVGDGLRALSGDQSFFTKHIVPIRAQVEAMRGTQALGETALRRSAGLE